MTARRSMPADFAERSAGKSLNQIISMYGCGASVAVRWRRELSGEVPVRLSPGPDRRPMPDDFAQHALETNKMLAERYRATGGTIKRWREQIGVKVNDPSAPVEVPQGFRLVAPELTMQELRQRYRRSEAIIYRWCRQASVQLRTIRKKTDKAQRPSLGGMGRAKPAPLNQHRDMTHAGQAADYLRRFGPVVRCNAGGQYDPTGPCWRRGSTILSADEVIARARRQGFNPDAWREVRAA